MNLPRSFAAAFVVVLSIGSSLVEAQPKKEVKAPQREELSLRPDEMLQPWKGDLDGMIDRRVIRVLTVYGKTFFSVNKGVQRGLTHDAFREFDDDLNRKLAKQGKLKSKHLRVQVIFVPVARDELLPALEAGKGDIAAANLTITDERRGVVDFSIPVYPGVSEVAVSGPGVAELKSAEELSGKTVFVRKSSSYYESLVALNRQFAEKKIPEVQIKFAPEALEDEDLIEMANAGLIPLTVVDRHIVDFWKQIFPKIVIHSGAAVRANAEIAWAIRKQSPLLKGAVDEFIGQKWKGTALADKLLLRYLKNTRYVRNAASDAERRKFLRLVDFFKKYGDRYDVDWVMMAAQGYQESRLNQDARSPVGAIGVMQVMPATGKDLAVGDITQTEPNIHAGIKYMRWMIDHYYGKEPMTRLDKALFAFAAYNAGAGRVSQLRKEAAKRGLDPNVWFHNVEYVAAEKIGAETVTYVSNIYKYYIAYNLVLDARAEREQARSTVERSK